MRSIKPPNELLVPTKCPLRKIFDVAQSAHAPAECGKRGWSGARWVDVRPNWKEQPVMDEAAVRRGAKQAGDAVVTVAVADFIMWVVSQ
jgi:hypothetical protein